MWCISFDFDGTLVQSNEIKQQTFFDVVLNIPSGIGVMESILSQPKPGDRFSIFEQFANICAGDFDAANLAEKYGDLCEKRVVEAEEVSGTLDCLIKLSVDNKLYVNSATPTRALESIIERRGLSQFFLGIFGSPQSKFQNLREISLNSGLPVEKTIVVGDGISDQEAALDFGCRFIGIGGFPQTAVGTPVEWIDDMTELPAVISSFC